MNKNELKLEGVKIVTHKGETFYNVKDLKKFNPYVKCDAKNAINVEESLYIKLDDLEPMTDFDKNIFKSLNFKPEK